MLSVTYDASREIAPDELMDFYDRVGHDVGAPPNRLATMIDNSAVFVSARDNGRLIGVARGVTDGVRGYLTECKLDPRYQGPAAVTKRDGRIEHDSYGVAAEMARRVIAALRDAGVSRVDVVAWGTEEDFLEELGFKRLGGLVGMTMRTDEVNSAVTQAGAAGA